MDAWTGGEKIAVSVGNYTGLYTMDAGGQATASDVPYYWLNTAPATVSAWWPYATEERTYDIADQSKGYAAFDLLYAEAEGSYAAPVQLTFSHQMAKVSYTLVKGEGITDAELTAAEVTLFGDRSVTVNGGKITGAATSQTDEIAPCANALGGSAVMVPQNMTGKPMIKISINGNDFYYAPDTEAAGNLQGGYRYSYIITVKAIGIEVLAITGGQWADGGSEDINSHIIVTAYTAEQLKIGDYVYADGTTSDGGLRYLLDDGTLRSTDIKPTEEKQCVGIIFHIRHDGSPQDECGYTEFQGKAATGYIVSLDQNTSKWCDEELGQNDQTPKDKINGYRYTSQYYAKYDATKNLIAINWCKNHTSIEYSDNITYTGWYMPSQWEYKLMRADGTMQVLDLIDANIQKASGVGFVNKYYSTVGLMGSRGNFLHMYNPKTGGDNAGDFINYVATAFPYRAVCAFRAKTI